MCINTTNWLSSFADFYGLNVLLLFGVHLNVKVKGQGLDSVDNDLQLLVDFDDLHCALTCRLQSRK